MYVYRAKPEHGLPHIVLGAGRVDRLALPVIKVFCSNLSCDFSFSNYLLEFKCYAINSSSILLED